MKVLIDTNVFQEMTYLENLLALLRYIISSTNILINPESYLALTETEKMLNLEENEVKLFASND